MSSIDEAFALLEAGLDKLAALSFDSCADDEVLQSWQRLERHRRQLAPVDHTMIAEVETCSLAFQHGCKNTIALVRQVVRIGAGEAHARVKARAGARAAPDVDRRSVGADLSHRRRGTGRRGHLGAARPARRQDDREPA